MPERDSGQSVTPKAIVIEDIGGGCEQYILKNVNLVDSAGDRSWPAYRQPCGVAIGKVFGGEGGRPVAVHVSTVTRQVWAMISGHDDDGITVAAQSRLYVATHLLSCDGQTSGVPS